MPTVLQFIFWVLAITLSLVGAAFCFVGLPLVLSGSKPGGYQVAILFGVFQLSLAGCLWVGIYLGQFKIFDQISRELWMSQLFWLCLLAISATNTIYGVLLWMKFKWSGLFMFT